MSREVQREEATFAAGCGTEKEAVLWGRLRERQNHKNPLKKDFFWGVQTVLGQNEADASESA